MQPRPAQGWHQRGASTAAVRVTGSCSAAYITGTLASYASTANMTERPGTGRESKDQEVRMDLRMDRNTQPHSLTDAGFIPIMQQLEKKACIRGSSGLHVSKIDNKRYNTAVEDSTGHNLAPCCILAYSMYIRTIRTYMAAMHACIEVQPFTQRNWLQLRIQKCRTSSCLYYSQPSSVSIAQGHAGPSRVAAESARSGCGMPRGACQAHPNLRWPVPAATSCMLHALKARHNRAPSGRADNRLSK